MIRTASLLTGLVLAPIAHAGGGLEVIGTLTRTAELAPGESASGEIVVRNTLDGPQIVRIHQQDYRSYADGHNDFLEPGSLERSNAAWVHHAPDRVVLPAGASAKVAWTMELPAGAEVAPGTWWSVLIVEPVPDPMEAVEEGLAVRTVFRYAIQMVTLVGEAPADIAFDATRLRAHEGTGLLEVDLSNPGDRWVRPMVWAQVFDEHGTDLGRFESRTVRIYPGGSARFQVGLEGLAAGRYQALVVADAGTDAVFGSQLTLDLTGLGAVATADRDE